MCVSCSPYVFDGSDGRFDGTYRYVLYMKSFTFISETINNLHTNRKSSQLRF